MNRLPEGWAHTKLGVLGHYVNGRAFKPTEWSASGRPIIRIQNLTGSSSTVNFFDGEVDPKHLVERGDLLVSWSATLGAYFWVGNQGVLNQHIFRVDSYINSRFHKYLVDHVLSDLLAKTHGSGMVHITRKPFDDTPVLLPPLAEQERIVAALEEQFSRLDTAVAVLERVQLNLKRMRDAIRFAATGGYLVTQDSNDEPASELIARTKPTGRFRGEGALPDDLGDLPPGWIWAPMARLSRRVTVGHVGPMKDEYVPTGIPFLRSQNVRADRFDPTGLLYIPRAFHERLGKSRLRPGDLLVVRSGNVGTACVVPEHLADANCADLVIVQGPEAINSRYASLYMNSLARARVRAGQVGVALTHFNTQSVAELPVPVPPMAEQDRIVAEADRLMSLVDGLELALAGAVARSRSMRSALLAAAFSGQLVPQDRTEEPASSLLERIATEGVSSNGHKLARAPSRTSPLPAG